jgi:hypothetical protein
MCVLNNNICISTLNNNWYISILVTKKNRTTKKRINISIHPIELAKLDQIADEYGETRSGMLTRIIQEFPKNKKMKYFK